MGQLDEVLERLTGLKEPQRRGAVKTAFESTKQFKWIPNPGPQTEAYFSKADILLFGGEPGGGKTGLLVGLAMNCHQRSLIMRRQYTDLGPIIDDLLRVHGSRQGFNGSPPPSLRLADGRIIELAAAARVGDEQHFQGNPHDFIGFDEGTQFAESQIRFLMGWLRSIDKKQRKRVVIATNPPLSAEGLWVVEMFAPWLNPQHPNPAKPGELRWFVTDEDGNDLEVPSGAMVMVDGKPVLPLSRTYIPSSVRDNPYLAGTNYESQLNALTEPYRSILLGHFRTTFRDAPNQTIPTDWVRAAQARWLPDPPRGVPMCAMGVDCSGGGDDPLIIAPRFDGWYAPLIEVPGKDIPRERIGGFSAGMVVSHRRDGALVVVDLGGGYGGSTYEVLKDNGADVSGYKGAEATTRRSRDGKLKFVNKRSAAYWTFREALDPGQPGGSPIALPESAKLMADLTAPTFEPTPNGIRVEAKEKVCARLGRSTDCGDAVVMAWFEGPRETTAALDWAEQREMGGRGRKRPQVIMSDRMSRMAARRH